MRCCLEIYQCRNVILRHPAEANHYVLVILHIFQNDFQQRYHHVKLRSTAGYTRATAAGFGVIKG